MKVVAVFWFRRDLRLHDNAGLYHCLKEPFPVLPVFIFDRNILDDLTDSKDRRVTFIHEALKELQSQLIKIGSEIRVYYDTPLGGFHRILEEFTVKVVYTNHDYEPYARKRDEKIKAFLHSRGIQFKTFKDQVIFEKDEILKPDKSPYTIYTPYSRKWLKKCSEFYLRSYRVEEYEKNFLRQEPRSMPSLGRIGFEKHNGVFPAREIPENILLKYDEIRDFPFLGTSRLGVHLRFGTISIRELAAKAKELNSTYLNELIWREFFQVILWFFPRVVYQSFRPEYDKIDWRNRESDFLAWCKGVTGFPFIDAGMRQLNETGFMHNRARMATANFLTKLLLVDWRIGEAYFAEKLLDYELASNNGNWQWAAGSGCDAAPYFRIFNPMTQQEKFDPHQKYVKKWIPELNSKDYPQPIIDYKSARQRALATYAKAVKKEE